MALTKLQEKDIRERIIASMRAKGYTKGRVKNKTGRKMGDIKAYKPTHGAGKTYGKDGINYAKSYIDTLKTKGSGNTLRDLHRAGAAEGVREGHKKTETGKSTLTLPDNVKKSGYKNMGEVNAWAKAKMAQYNAIAKAGKMTKSELSTFKDKVKKRRDHWKTKKLVA